MGMRDRSKPPRMGEWILKRCLRNEDRLHRAGDFEEVFQQIVETEARFKAWRWYWWQVVRSVPELVKNSIFWGGAMFKNYLKIALRNIVKYKGYSFINIVGLTVGIACSTLILLWVQDELYYDRFHKKSDNIHRVILRHQFAGDRVLTTEVSPPPLAKALVDEVPEIVNATRYKTMTRKYRIAQGGTFFNETRLALADPAFLDIFTFHFLRGESQKALSEPHSLIITEEMANKYFGTEDPVGKTINIDKKYVLKVTGVIENIPNHSSLQFDFLAPFEFIRDLWPNHRLDVYWNNINETYVLCRDHVSIETLNLKIKGFIKAHWEPSVTDIFLQPLNRIHLFTLTGEAGAIQYVRHFLIIALFILFIACINFMNLSTARSARRAKEVGLRKVVGAERAQLIKQFLGESVIYTVISLVVAVVLVKLLIPSFNQFCMKDVDLDYTDSIQVFCLSGIIVLTGILSGCYPAFFLSSFSPVSVLKGGLQKSVKGRLFRKILVTAQFTLSIVLIVCTIVIYRQMAFIQDIDLGLTKDHILHMEVYADFRKTYEALRNELSQHPDVLNITAANQIPTQIRQSSSGIDWDGKDPDEVINMVNTHVDFGYFEIFQMRMAEGRTFSRAFATDSMNYILNEKAAQLLDKEKIIGERFNMWGKEGTIVGVVKNFHFDHLSNEIRPLIITITPRYFAHIIVRVRGENMTRTIEDIKSVWNRIAPDYPFEFRFFDEDFDRLYRTEQRMAKLFAYFTLLAILISCLGLFSLTSFMTEQRTKEIGIRKVLGASVSGLVLFLSEEFLKLVLLANIIAWPIAYFAMNRWLQSFAYRTDIGIWILALSTSLTLIVASLTVGYQSVKAATADPVESLKYE